jgi:hypothetical protein
VHGIRRGQGRDRWALAGEHPGHTGEVQPAAWRLTNLRGGLPIVKVVRNGSQGNFKLVVESAAFGLGYTAVLIWAGSAIVASFSNYEATPYWPTIPHLRTDTAGVLAFAVAAVTLVLSRYLQLSRRTDAPAQPVARPVGVLAIQAVAETAAVLATALVVYLSLNAVTHPITLRLQLTHLWPWPSEGTVRVIALGVCLTAVAASRYLRSTRRHNQTPTVLETSDDTGPRHSQRPTSVWRLSLPSRSRSL